MEKQKIKTVKLTTNQTVRIPTKIVKQMGLKKDNSFEVVLTTDGILLVPLVQIPKSQEYYWTKEWQEGERDADKDIEKGRLESFDNADDLFDSLSN